MSLNFVMALLIVVVNKRALHVFPYPAALTSFHYLCSWGGTISVRRAGVFEAKQVPPENYWAFWLLLVCWTSCNALSNASLGANSVGFYQIMKVFVTPVVVVTDYFAYGKTVTAFRCTLLAVACWGIAVATISDVQFNIYGATIATAAVGTGVAQKIFNSHMQQHAGLSTLQLMDASFPAMTALSLLIVPVMDSPDFLNLELLAPRACVDVVASGVVAFLINYSCTLVLGVTSALALVLLAHLKTVGVILLGAMFYDGTPDKWSVVGSGTALVSMAAFTLLAPTSQSKVSKLSGEKDLEMSGSVLKSVPIEIGKRNLRVNGAF